MEKFFQVFVESCGNLVLFTQNVTSVKFFHLSSDGDPLSPHLLVHVQKDVLSRNVVSLTVAELKGRNILSFVDKEWKKHAKSETSIILREESVIKRNICNEELTRLENIKPGLATVPWNITWVTGSKESASFALSETLRGLLPLAAVAVPFKHDCESKNVLYLDKCPQGFYREGHLVCFLPLPLKIPFPVHINATFALTPDRRQLCTKTEDDKMMVEAAWNEALKMDAVSRAYVSALSGLPITAPSDIDAYYNLWPVSGEDPLVKGFYRLITKEEKNIFIVQCNESIRRSPFQSLKYLDPQLCTDNDIGDIAFKAAEHFWPYNNVHLVKIPTVILDSFKRTGFETALLSRCLSRLEFFQNIFFPNISDTFWSSEERDKLTVYALGTTDPDIHDLMKHSSCIPTRPSGTLKQPSELVQPSGQCAAMFSDDDECFPRGDSLHGFCVPRILEVLVHLGMVKNDLPGTLLLERANSVCLLHRISSQHALRRCKEILRYISYVDYSSKTQRFSQYPDTIKAQLKEISFFSILQRPVSWPSMVPWKADVLDGQTLTTANELFSDCVANLVACSDIIIDSKEFHHVSNIRDVLNELGLKQRSELDIHTVARQLYLVADVFHTTNDSKILMRCSTLCSELYDYLNSMCQEGNDVEDVTRNKEIIKQTLGNECVILTGQKMVHPHQVAFDLSHNLSPHLYESEKIHERFKTLFVTLGVKQKFGLLDILNVMRTIAKSTGSEKLSKENHTCFGRLASCLSELLLEDSNEDICEIRLPDENGFLQEASSLCLNDCDTVEDDATTMRFIHPDIHQKVAKWFGVKGKREADLSDHITVSPIFSSFGQSEKLTTRLQRILSGYPCDVSIMKELLQNADDADATELMFIKDFRSLPTEKIFSENWASVQGPALCVYNNSYFSDKDFAGIRNLGEGSKGDDPVKTGQYGVGFNAVYHLTDVPSFMTIGPTTEKTICALDPHVKYVPWATSKAPGGKLIKLEKIRGKYKDAFSGYLEDCVPLQQKGTLFRFPLRTESMAEESLILKREITTDMVSKLLDDFKYEMFDSLLFVHSVKKITISHITEDGELIKEYWVESKMNDSDTTKQKGFLSHLRTQAENVKDHSTGIGISDVAPLEIQLSLSVEDSTSRQQQWLVIHRSGFTQDKDLPESLIRSWERGDIGLLPRGGVAVPLSSAADDFKGKAFCILPLPIETGLPVHINGHFALDHEARRNLWHGTTDYRCDWNKHTVETIIIPAYISAIQALKIELQCTKQMPTDILQIQLRKYYSFYPDIVNATDTFWKSVMKGFYCDLVARKCTVFSVIKPDKGKFCDFPKDRKEAIMGKVVWVPLTVHKGFPGYFNNLHKYFPVERSEFRGPHISPAKEYDRYNAALNEADRKMRILTEVLRDLNMKVIYAPHRIYSNLVESNQEENILSVTPDTVICFLKSHSDEYHDKCMIGSLPKKVSETPLKSITTLKLLTGFIAKLEIFASEICGLPLAATSSETVGIFENANPLIVSHYSDLLKSVPDIVLHNELTTFYLQHVMNSPSLRPLSLDQFTELLPQLLDENTFRCERPIPWINQENPSRKWIVRLWRYLEEEVFKAKEDKEVNNTFIRSQLQKIESWCIFPAKTESTHLFLYPLIETAKILNMDSVSQDSFRFALTKLHVPHFDQTIWRIDHSYSFRDNKLAPRLVASWDRPGTVLFVLSEMKLSEIEKLTFHETENFLHYFCTNLNAIASQCEHSREKLMRLPFYISLTGKLVRIQNVHVVKDSSILPKDGLTEWTEQTGITLVQYSILLAELYIYINQSPLTPSQVYSTLLIPHFQFIPSQFRPVHIKCIRDKLLMKAEDYSQEQEALIQQMKMLNFIETTDGTLHKACDFYSKRQIVFSAMCPPSAFPPFPYSENEWYRFLVLIGLQVDVTVDHFVEFAKETERKGSNGITEEVAYKSEILTDHLYQRPDKVQEGILLRIRDIKFLLPYIVKEEHKYGNVLIKIHQQIQEAKFLVCYSQSTSPRHCYCVWTNKTMYRRNSDPSRTEYGRNLKSAYAQLGMNETPSLDTVIKHVQNVCSSVSKMQKKSPLQDENLTEVLMDVMTAVYTYFQDSGVSETVKEMLSSTCIILLPDERIMVAAKQVVTTLSKREVIPGYIYSGPSCLGQFFPVFHLLGASENASAKHFALVLNSLKDDVGDNEMNPNELQVVKMAMESLFKYLNDNDGTSTSGMQELSSLFLPSQKKIMTLSQDLVFSDNKFLKSRVKKLDFNYFIGFRGIEMQVSHPLVTICLLPQNHRPLILTAIVKEVLSETSKQTSHEGTLSQQISDVIEAPEFISGVMRLINDARCCHGNELLSESDCEKMENDLHKLKIFEVEDLHTVLTHEEHVVADSETRKPCCFDDSDNEVCIYLSKDVQPSDFDTIYTNLAFAIDKLTGLQLGRHTNWLSSMLKAVPRQISSLLDSWQIVAFEYIGGMFSTTAFPPAGTIIPEKFHFMLDNSFGYFKPGEYAGYEVYDHLIDEDATDESQFKECVFMVYVIIKRVVTQGDNPLLGRYIIEGKDGRTEEVSATQLYKFTRDKDNICTDIELSDLSLDSAISVSMNMKVVLKDIRKTLKDAWALLGEKDRNRVKKRLYLKWHPDKNPDRKEFCDEVCKYIALYVQKLERGSDIDDIGDDVSQGTSPWEENPPDYSWFYNFDARSRTQRDYQKQYETYQEQRGSRHGSGFWEGHPYHQSEAHDVYPHHLEAMRWFRQARADLDAATEVLGLTRAYNWLCFKCQQAAEKAVKALWYNRDARYADSIRSHDICSIANGLADPVLTDLLSRLQNIVKDFERLRYPDRLSYPSIPADVYTDVDARQACELALQIITHVDSMLK